MTQDWFRYIICIILSSSPRTHADPDVLEIEHDARYWFLRADFYNSFTDQDILNPLKKLKAVEDQKKLAAEKAAEEEKERIELEIAAEEDKKFAEWLAHRAAEEAKTAEEERERLEMEQSAKV